MSWSNWLRGLSRTMRHPYRHSESRGDARPHRFARLRCERLEERWAPAVGDLLLTITNPTPTVDGNFGFSVAALGNNFVVGTPGDDTINNQAGAAYLLDGVTGVVVHTLTGPQNFLGRFGAAVAAVGNNIVVGAPRAQFFASSSDRGLAYLFNGANRMLRIFVNPTGELDEFGSAAAAVGNNVLIGARGDRFNGVSAGKAYLFDAATAGAVLHTLDNPSPEPEDNFGYAVAAVGNNLLVGAPGDNTGGNDSGAAYLFDGVTGALLHTLINPAPAAGDNFGFSIAVMGNNVLVAAPGDNTGGDNSGAAYLFNGLTGTLLHTFINPSQAVGDLFGSSVAAVGNNFLLGAPGDNTGGDNSGAAYLFDGATGALLHTFINPSQAANDQFGFAVTAVGNNILVGTPYDNTGGNDSGAVYLFDGTSYDIPAGNGPDDMLLQRNGSNVEIIDNSNGNLVFSQPLTKGAIIIAGADDEDDTLTVQHSTLAFGKAIHFAGGSGGNDRLRIVGAGGNDAQYYVPSGTTPGAGRVSDSANGSTTAHNVTFQGVEPLEITNVLNLLLETPNSADELTIDPDLGPDDVPANVISGSSGGVAIAPLTFHNAQFISILAHQRDRLLADDRITISSDLIAQGLKNFTIFTGKGRDELEIAATSYDLPVAGGQLKFNAGVGADKITVIADVDMTLTNTALTSSGGGKLVLSSVEEGWLVGDSGDNVFNSVAFTGKVTLAGMDGDDFLTAGAGSDLLIGGDGDNYLHAGNGNNILDGGDGDDELFAGTGLDVLDGGEGNNNLEAGAGNDILRAGAGNDSLRGGTGSDLLEAGDGDDYLSGWTGNDRLFGGAGNDEMLGYTGNDYLDAGDGDDYVDGQTGNDQILGGDGNDTLYGDTGNDSIWGGDGDDGLFGQDGADWLIGGLGLDLLIGGFGTNILED